jgi:RNA polymerase sigma factor (TIGR02999 family)
MSKRPQTASVVLAQLRDGDDSAAARLLPIVYDELRALAGHYFRRQPSDHTLQPTALVHEAFVRLIADDGGWADRGHFIALAAQAMRQILVDHARKRAAAKRGGDHWKRITLDDGLAAAESRGVDVLVLEDAMTRLAALSARQAQIVELRVYGGLTIEEVAALLDIGPTTVKADWTIAKTWLKRELGHRTRHE